MKSLITTIFLFFNLLFPIFTYASVDCENELAKLRSHVIELRNENLDLKNEVFEFKEQVEIIDSHIFYYRMGLTSILIFSILFIFIFTKIKNRQP